MKSIFTTLMLFGSILFFSGGPGISYAQGVNCTVNAGGNAIVCGASTTLTGGLSGTAGAGGPSWTFISGPTVPTIATPNSFNTSVTGMTVNGDYIFRLSHPCGSGLASSTVTITAHPRPASFTAGPDITTICATTGTTNLSGVIPAGYTGSWRAVNIFSFSRFGTFVSTNAQFSSTTSAIPTFYLINKSNHEIDPAYYAILRITSLDGICSYEDSTIVRFIPNPQIVAPTTVSKCRTQPLVRDYLDLQSTSPAFASGHTGSAGTVASGTTVSATVTSQPAGANLTFDEIETRRLYLNGMSVDGTYVFTLTVTNACGTYTTAPIAYTYSGTSPYPVIFNLNTHPEQYAAYASTNSAGEIHCASKVGTTTAETFYFDIDPLDPASVVTTVTAAGFYPPGGAPTISVSGAGTYNRIATVTPPSGGWQAGTYKLNVQTSNGSCSRTQPYYIHVSDNNRPNVAVADQSICYPGTGTISATIALPAIYQGVVNSSYFQDFSGSYGFTVLSRPAGSAVPIYTAPNLRSLTSSTTTIDNLNRAGDYVFRITAAPTPSGIGPFLDQEYSCSGTALSATFTIHVENPINANAGSDQAGVCSHSVSLLGNNPGTGTGAWTLIQAPAGANPVIASATSFSTSAYSLDSVGQYRFAWKITSPLGGCISSDTVSFQVTCPLPVSLISFSADKQNNKVDLQWITASEENNWGFEIERSADSKDWTLIGAVRSLSSTGTTHFQSLYKYADLEPLEGDNFYRIKQKDYDGKFTYSPVRLVTFSQVGALSLFPNHTRESVTIKGLKGAASISIYNTKGQLVYSAKGHEGSMLLNLKQLPAGIYICTVADTNGSQIAKLTIVKEP
ncbi:hypothetical protein DBR32_15550 [Taibaiella sp. KBW10]|uniref:T9SS type A sorting domain-containing protein n=1 Tax=Taibaiella sp. KBW10 TaxID=2153357 RepID=UPI000F5B3FE5|nr:T9SS type A sorting domain-containing protein [Taibaiella sp. KBW10]RQO29672.1 hypothetical protein DBR32_15550 [Taibaiella sp. KBW10]